MTPYAYTSPRHFPLQPPSAAATESPPRRSLTALAGRMAGPYSAAVGSGGMATALPTPQPAAPRGVTELTPLQKAHYGAVNAAIRHNIGGLQLRMARAAAGVGPAWNATQSPPASASAPPVRNLIEDSRASLPSMQAAQTPEGFRGRGAVIGRTRTPQDDIQRATQAARALQDVLSAPQLRRFRSSRQAIANEFSRAMGAQDSQQAHTHNAAENSALEQARQAHERQQANANRRQQAAQFNAQQFAQEQQAQRSLSAQADQPWQMNQTADGTPGIIRNSGRFTPITDADGAPVALARPEQGLSPDTLFKAFTEQENTIRSGLGTPEEQRQQLNQLYRNPLFQPLLQRYAPSPEAQLTPDGQWVRQLPDGRWQAYGAGAQ